MGFEVIAIIGLFVALIALFTLFVLLSPFLESTNAFCDPGLT